MQRFARGHGNFHRAETHKSCSLAKKRDTALVKTPATKRLAMFTDSAREDELAEFGSLLKSEGTEGDSSTSTSSQPSLCTKSRTANKAKLIKTNVHRLDFGEANHGTEDMVIASISDQTTFRYRKGSFLERKGPNQCFLQPSLV